MSVRGGLVLAGLVAMFAGCATTPGGLTFPDAGTRRDGGSAADGGEKADGGQPTLDGGGAATDGGSPEVDGGSPLVDGGATAADGGVSDGGAACHTVTVTPSSISTGIDCDAVVSEATVRAQVCAGRRLADGLYNEDTGGRGLEWATEGDGSGHVILGCRDTLSEARQLIEQGSILDFTGCAAETDDYYSLEASLPGETQKTYYRVNKCSPWPYVLDSPSSTAMGLGVGQVGPAGLTVDAALVAHAAQYLWFVERDFRTTVFVVGARSFSTSPLSHALCEVELSGNSILVRKVTFAVDRLSRNITRAVEPKTTFPANCP